MDKNLWPVHCKAGSGKSMVVKLNPTSKLSLLVIDTQQDFASSISVSSYSLIRWSEDKVVFQLNPPDRIKLSDCPEKVTMGERLNIGSRLISIKDLPKYLGLCDVLDAEIAAILSE